MSQYLETEFKEDYYAILGIERTANVDEITKAYREKARYYHPDKGGNEHLFKLLNEANAVLSDSIKKKRYDEFWDRTFKSKNSTPKNETRIAVVKDYYKALNIAKTDDQKAIRDAYLKVLKQFRPKLDEPDSEFARTVIACAEEAYGVLSRPEAKSLYDGEYDRVYTIARSFETPRVHGEKTYIAKRPPVYVAPTPKVTPQKPVKVQPTAQTDIVKTQTASASPLVVKYNDKDVFVSTINRELLKKADVMVIHRTDKKISLQNLYAIFQEDNSFTFAQSIYYPHFIGPDEHYLKRVPSGMNICYIETFSNDLPWAKQTIIELGGLQSLSIPAEKIIPCSLVDAEGQIGYLDLQRIRENITNIMANHPEMVKSFFNGSKQM